MLLVWAIRAQNPSPSLGKSPKEIVEAFYKMEYAGGRLTDGGWYQAAEFFVKPSPPPKQLYVAVHAQSNPVFHLDPLYKETNRALVHGSTSSGLGQLDPSGRFTPVALPRLIDKMGHPVKNLEPPLYGPLKMLSNYELVLTGTHWEFGPNRELREVKGNPEWRIEAFDFQPQVSPDAAIRYLTKLRDESKNEMVKANATKSIQMLSRYVGAQKNK